MNSDNLQIVLDSHKRRQMWVSLIGTGLVSGAGAVVLNFLFPDWRFVHYPIHAAIESIGSFAAIIVAVLVLGLRKHGHLGPAYTWVAAALVGMGLLDGLHSLLHAGNGFVWLHSIATLIGGVMFALVWLAETPLLMRLGRHAPMGIFVAVLTIGIASIAYPNVIPNMIVDGDFSFLARAANIVGGVGFLIASMYFMLKVRQGDDARNRLIFSSICFLFGISGVIFEFSVIWDAAWWLWHALRICAYLIAVLFYFKLAKNIEEELSILKKDLEVRVSERTQDLQSEVRVRQIAEMKYRESEERTRQILNSAVDGIYGVDLDGLCTFINPAASSILGYDEDELIGKKQHTLLHHTKADGSPYPISECPIYQAFKDGVEREVSDEVFWRKDGTNFCVEYTSTPIEEDGAIKGAVVVFRNISDRKVLQEQLIQSSKMATLGEMATGVAHELNQPLNIIRMAVGNIERKNTKGILDGEYLSGKLLKITTQIERAATIIDHMRIFGRKPSAEKSQLDPARMIESVLEMIGEQLRLSNIDVVTELTDTGNFVFGHQVQVEQVLLNLLTNARDVLVSREGNAKRIWLRIVNDADGQNVRFEVEDSGGGIDPADLPRIFEPFYTTKEIGKGTGLGLSISYGIINDMGGLLEVHNTGRGACFVITLAASEAGMA